MNILQEFGVNPLLLAAQIVNFLIILYLLKRFAYKPIFKMLNDRKKTIAEGIKNAEEAAKALEKATEEEKKVLRKAQEEAQRILSDAKNQADATMSEARDTARKQVEQMLDDARAKIAEDTKAMEKQLAVSTAAMAVDLLKQSVKDIFTAKEQQEAVNKLSKKISKKN